MHEYEGGITVELKDTEEIVEAKITKRVFHVAMEQVKVVNPAHAQICVGKGRHFVAIILYAAQCAHSPAALMI